ncbi:hypothetical protein A2U01_0109783, partial [Trifolium medium]|nr:hypothetical protein [Trifolium medium]
MAKLRIQNEKLEARALKLDGELEARALKLD